jgi:site-specific DNA-cytosine methylase
MNDLGHQATPKELWQRGLLETFPLHKLRPSDCRNPSFSSTLEPGPDYLRDLFLRFLGQLSAAEKTALLSWVARDLEGHVSFASVCSGTDCPVFVWAALKDALRVHCGADLTTEHVFSCEVHPDKQKFLLQAMKVPCLFKDVRGLVSGRALDVVSGTQKPVKRFQHMFGGFPCQDASMLSAANASLASRNCVADGSKRTGSVFRSVVDLIKTSGEHMFGACLENVQGLAVAPRSKGGEVVGPDNLTVCTHILKRDANCHTVALTLDPRLFGVPQSRERIYMLVYPRRVVAGSSLSSQAIELFHIDLLQCGP